MLGSKNTRTSYFKDITTLSTNYITGEIISLIHANYTKMYFSAQD